MWDAVRRHHTVHPVADRVHAVVVRCRDLEWHLLRAQILERADAVLRPDREHEAVVLRHHAERGSSGWGVPSNMPTPATAE